MVSLLESLLGWLSGRWSYLVPLAAAAFVLYNNVLGIISNVQWVISEFDSLAAPSLGSHGISVATLGLVNYVLPLDLALGMFILWVPLLQACCVIRIIKAFIPTIS